jgi:hypothetical protein
MDPDRTSRPGGRLPLMPADSEPRSAGRTRNDGIKRVRHMSNWTAAALIVGTGATTVALASHSFPVGSSAATSATTSTGTSTATGTTTTTGPHVAGSVVTSGGSGATVTTTTHVVNGKTVVTQVKHPAVYHDN